MFTSAKILSTSFLLNYLTDLSESSQELSLERRCDIEFSYFDHTHRVVDFSVGVRFKLL